ncbi:response regulator transcription factor [Bacillus sp. FJAT-49732]|uniref:Response regulator transcription factor n=1 Tax=Lederbergia citrisecunda TaxID=2833583 RepID=A0A942YN93_9BACI|nr:response regulator transcription factor [Lederbergia citrisecunda]MBS4202369.1 response regulator transcription factor [Lederbergia citrisecunda]
MNKETILIVDDDDDIRKVLELYLCDAGYRVIEADNGYTVMDIFEQEKPDLIILDVMLPGLDGLEVCQMIRRKSDVPILFLSAKEDDIDKIVGLGVGGDDYISKPFSPSVLTAKVKAHLRRNRQFDKRVDAFDNSQSRKPIISYPGLVIDQESYSVKANGKDIHLSTKEYQILCLLAANPNRVFSFEQLFQMIWGESSFGDHRTVMVHISNLRKKIEDDPTSPEFISTVRGIGYKFNSDLY